MKIVDLTTINCWPLLHRIHNNIIKDEKSTENSEHLRFSDKNNNNIYIIMKSVMLKATLNCVKCAVA